MKVLKARIVTLEKRELEITTEYIKLDSALKLCGIAQTGGEAKFYIEENRVKVNNEVCLMRGKKLRDGDTFEIDRYIYTVKNVN